MNYFCGMTGVSFAAYLVATFFGTIPVTAMYVYLGYLGQSVATGSMGWLQWALLGLGLAATVAVTVLITRKVRPKLQNRKQRQRELIGLEVERRQKRIRAPRERSIQYDTLHDPA
jgi:membrane protein DedA with SNARE-associated domain